MEKQLEKLLDLLSLHGGSIICTASLTDYDIKQAMASSRIWVSEHYIGFVWMPEILDFPTTEKEIKQFEEWFPLEIELPENLKDLNFLKPKK